MYRTQSRNQFVTTEVVDWAEYSDYIEKEVMSSPNSSTELKEKH